MEIKKTGRSQYGFYLQDKEEKFTGCTEDVNKYLSEKTPCEIKVVSTIKEGKYTKISKVEILGYKTPEKASNNYEEANKYKQASVMLSYAKDLVVAGKIELNQMYDYAQKFLTLQEELVKETPAQKKEEVLTEKVEEIKPEETI